MLPHDEAFPVEVVGEFTDYHLEVLADLLIDLVEQRDQEAEKAA